MKAAATVIFLLGLLIIMAAAAYSGHVFPSYPTGMSTYDKNGYFFELTIWLLTLLSGAFLGFALWRMLQR